MTQPNPRYELVITGTAEVIKGPLTLIRELCESRQTEDEEGVRVDIQSIWPSEILEILDGEK